MEREENPLGPSSVIPFGTYAPPAWVVFFALQIFGFFLYSPTLPYPFVYDDLARIPNNPAVINSQPLSNYFLDPQTQSGIKSLNHDNYRPLVTLNFRADYKFFNNNTAGYRLENILLHACNAFFVYLLAIRLAGLGHSFSFVAALFFLVHPVQTESVIWIAGRSNLWFLFFSLLGILQWEKYLKLNRLGFVLGSYACFFMGLFIRENMIIQPILYWAIDRWNKKRSAEPDDAPMRIVAKRSVSSFQHVVGWNQVKLKQLIRLISRSRPKTCREDGLRFLSQQSPMVWKHYSTMALMGFVYLYFRHSVLGQFAQSPFWGAHVYAHASNVINVFFEYWRVIFWPTNLCISYSDIELVSTLMSPGVWRGLILLIGCIVAAAYLNRKTDVKSLFLWLFLLAWIPTSNIIPLRTLFAERLTYPMMPFIVIAVCGIAQNLIDTVRIGSILKKLVFMLVFIIFLVFVFLTRGQTKVWANDYTLWLHATKVKPNGWFGWYSLGLVAYEQSLEAQRQHHPPSLKYWLEAAESSFMSMLKNKPPLDTAAEGFQLLSEINTKRGQPDLAKEHKRRAIELRKIFAGQSI